MTGFTLFAQLTKADAVERIVTGVAANEALDKAGERFHYESSAPEFRKWSSEIQKGSGGKSFGNVRVMHQPIVAGILTDLECDDATKSVRIAAKIISDEAWKMVEAGAYTGFSIGGRYAKRWSDPGNPVEKWYTAIPSEVSVVDLPANPDAHFAMIKADGVVEQRSFGNAVAEDVKLDVKQPADPDPAPAPELKPAAPHTADGVVQRWLAKDSAPFLTKAEALKHNEQLTADEAAQPTRDAAARLDAALALAKGGDAPGDGAKPYGNVTYADEGHQADGKKRYPIDTEAHIRAAWNYIHKPKNAGKYSAEQAAGIKGKIAAAWRSKIDEKGPPEAAQKADEAQDLLKSLWDVGDVACLIQKLRMLKDGLAMEAAMENEDPTLADKAQTLIDEMCAFLTALVAEETREIMTGTEIPAEVVTLAAASGEIAKAIAGLPNPTDAMKALMEALEKAGSKHSREDQARLDLAHHALTMAHGMGGLSKADDGHVDRALGALRDAGAAPGPHYVPGHNSTVDSGHPAVSVPQGGDAPGPHYQPGHNSTVDTGHTPTPVPQGSPNADGHGSNIAMMKAAIDMLDALAKRHGGHKALIGAAHDLVAKVADGALCDVGKAGARHSAETMAHLTEAHDHLLKMGAVCKAADTLGALPPNTAPTEGEGEGQGAAEDHAKLDRSLDLAKRDVEFATLTKVVGELTGRMESAAAVIGELVAERGRLSTECDELRGRLVKVEAEPLPPKTIARPGLVPGLGEPSDEQIAKALESMTEDERNIFLVKAAIRTQNLMRG